MTLPLLARTADQDTRFLMTPRSAARHQPAVDRMPSRAPGVGEQYRFHIDMGRCIGCKCCVVACNEQNGNPAAINWRRVGELEGGWYPQAMRSYLSMGCNHCVNPTCLTGCPVDAYTKDAATGIVRHSADTCIGCQYCTWNCSYGVPQYNPARGVVGKCDMCHGRLAEGQAPACVSACPEGAIAIEIVRVADWRAAVATAVAGAGLPGPDGSLSTTRVTMPAQFPPNAQPTDLTHVTPEHPHWALVFMTVLTQLAVGAFAAIWLLEITGTPTRLGAAALLACAVAALALSGATLHLGRPAYAYRALKMWRRSWLSREVALFGAFSAVAPLYAAMLWLGLPGSPVIGALTVGLGLAGVTASACIYRVPARPAWNSRLTVVHFNTTAAVLGFLLVAASGAGAARWPVWAAVVSASIHLGLLALRLLRFIATDRVELRGTARLLSTTLRRPFIARGVLLVAGGCLLPLAAEAGHHPLLLWTSLTLAVAGEILGRYLFFVSVVPTHMATPYIAMGSETV